MGRRRKEDDERKMEEGLRKHGTVVDGLLQDGVDDDQLVFI